MDFDTGITGRNPLFWQIRLIFSSNFFLYSTTDKLPAALEKFAATMIQRESVPK